MLGGRVGPGNGKHPDRQATDDRKVAGPDSGAATTVRRPGRRSSHGRVATPRSRLDKTVALGAAGVAAGGWWWTARMSHSMGDSAMSDGIAARGDADPVTFAAFAVSWVAMMAAMMLPAVAPVLSLYRAAAAGGRVAPVPFFAGGYLAAWAAVAVPAYLAWRELEGRVPDAAPFAGRLAGGLLVVAATWQLSPLKSACLRHCRSPLSFFLRHSARAAHPGGALWMGAAHGAVCVGCCWALMAVVVATGTTSLLWLAALAVLVFVERNTRVGERVAMAAAVPLAAGGVVLVVHPRWLVALT